MTMTANGLAKLIEECGELLQVAGKKLAYFHTDEHPDNQGSLEARIGDEIADVMAACDFVRATMLEAETNLDIDIRRDQKFARFKRWHDMTDNNTHGIDRPSAVSEPDERSR